MTTGSGGPSSEERAYRWVLEHSAAVRGFLLSRVRNADVADDLAQEVFRRAWQARDRYREEGHERSYLLTIADRLACDWARRRRVEVTVDDDAWRSLEPADGKLAADENMLQRESLAELSDAMERLTPVQQRVLLLRYYGEMKFEQIAGTLGCPLSTVLSHCHRGLAALRRMLVESSE